MHFHLPKPLLRCFAASTFAMLVGIVPLVIASGALAQTEAATCKTPAVVARIADLKARIGRYHHRINVLDAEFRKLEARLVQLGRGIDSQTLGTIHDQMSHNEYYRKQLDTTLDQLIGELDKLESLPACEPPKLTSIAPATLSTFDQFILDVHNAERAKVGSPPLTWNPQLALDARAYAVQLAKIDQLVHAPREARGIERENLLQAPAGWSPTQMMDLWVGEKRYFHPGIFPDVCSGSDWSQCAHYTQMIWPTTTDLGCGMAPGGGFNWVVCRYSPGGNKDGKPVGTRLNLPERGM